MDLIRDLRRWVAALLRWILDAWRLVVPLLVTALVLTLALRVPEGVIEPVVRCSGLVLQLLGILTVVAGLRDKRRLFDRPSLLESVRRWLNRHPRWRPKPQTIQVAGAASLSVVGSARATLWRGAPSDAAVEVRLAALEANLVTLRNEHAETTKEIQEAIRKVSETTERERRAHDSAIATVRRQLEGLGAGSLHVEMMGVFWLILGVTLGTASVEIATMLKWLR